MDQKYRERLMLLGGIGLVALFLLFFPAIYEASRASDLDKKITSQKRTLKEVQQLAVEYATIKSRSATLENKMKVGGPPLLSYLETICRSVQIANPALNPLRTAESEYYDETSVELKVTGLTLEKLENLLKNIESSPRYLRVKSFKAETPYAHKDLLDVTLQVSSYNPKSAAPKPEPGKETPPEKETP